MDHKVKLGLQKDKEKEMENGVYLVSEARILISKMQ
jgi:hypothetical protein